MGNGHLGAGVTRAIRELVLASLLVGGCLACSPQAPSSLQPPSNVLTDVEAIYASSGTTCARRRDASMWCWGDSTLTVDKHKASYVTYARPTEATDLIAVVSGGSHVCVVRKDGSVACDGVTTFGVTGAPETNHYLLGLTTVVHLSNVVQLGTGVSITCARTRDGTVACWGLSADGLRPSNGDPDARTDGERDPRAHEVAAVPGLPPVADLSVGNAAALAVATDGSAWMVGGRNRGIHRVEGITDAVQASSGVGFHCVRRRSGDIACWRDDLEALTDNPKIPTTPSPVTNVHGATAISAGAFGACALLVGGVATCWGRYPFSASATGPDANVWLEARAVTEVSGLRALALGNRHACGLHDDGTVQCWGERSVLGYGEADDLRERQMGLWTTCGPEYVRTTDAPRRSPAAPRTPARRGPTELALLAFTFAAVIAGLALARRLNGPGSATWPSRAPTAVGTGYRGSALTITRPPLVIRLATYVGLGSVGADVAPVALEVLQSFRLWTLATNDREAGLAFVVGSLASALQSVMMLGWLVFVAVTLVSAARTSKKALGRLRIVGVLGSIGHVALMVATASEGFLLRAPLDSDSLEDSVLTNLLRMVLLASGLAGVCSSILMIVAARHRRDVA